jgi:hypothetical protein
MKVIRPTTMTESMLISSNAVEAHPEWSISTTYAKGARVIYGASIYESLVNSNVGHQPDTSIVQWVRIGPDNTWAMFDPQISTQTTTSTNLTVTVATGTIDSVYLGNVVGLSATITVRDGLGGPMIYQQTQSLTGETVGDWYQYFFFDPLLLRNQAIFQGIPPYAGSHLTIEIEGSGTVALGMVTFGRVTMIGSTSYGASAGIIDYSRKDTNEFGETTFVQRAFSKRLSANVMVHNSQLNRVQRLLYDLRAVPVVWLGNNDAPEFEEPMVVFGFYRDFSTDVAYPTVSFCSLEIEGLI